MPAPLLKVAVQGSTTEYGQREIANAGNRHAAHVPGAVVTRMRGWGSLERLSATDPMKKRSLQVCTHRNVAKLKMRP